MEKRSSHARITLRMTEEVHTLLSGAIEASGRSMNSEINQRLLDSFKQPEFLEEITLLIKKELAKKSG